MSWSVNASGSISEVRGQLAAQFKIPLAEGSAGLENAGERETVQKTFDLVEQVLSTFPPEGSVAVTASGHLGYQDWTSKAGGYQQISIQITPQP